MQHRVKLFKLKFKLLYIFTKFTVVQLTNKIYNGLKKKKINKQLFVNVIFIFNTGIPIKKQNV